MNERISTKTNGQAIFVPTDCKECASPPKDVACFAVLILKHKDFPKKDYMVVITSDHNTPLIFPDQGTGKVALEP